MHYDTARNQHGLKHDPFKALVAPRPVGWIGTRSPEGRHNLAPYSFFNAVSDRPPMVMFSSGGFKDSLRNVLATGEFTCSVATFPLREAMNMSSAAVAPGVDEFALAGLTAADSPYVKAPFVAEAPAALACTLWQTLELPSHREGVPSTYTLVIGRVVGIHIRDDVITPDGLYPTAALQPLARMGYMDFSMVTPEATFTMNRPLATADGQGATLQPGPWDGVYR
jgi:flavin reductase (DIM6/NTAB) family NADH-FMN oxidoreductase RutF